ncbi:MAG: LUD domain-containing protein [Thermoleophilaceae bacterium]
MNEAREAVLGRVRTALRDAPMHAPAPARGYRTEGDLDRAGVLDRFAERVADYRAEVTRTSARRVAEAVGDVCTSLQVTNLGMPSGLSPGWLPDGVGRVEDTGLSVAELDALDGALTGCAVAIAETGTVVLDGSRRSGRRALTLVPDLHICVVEADDVMAIVPEAIERLGAAAAQGRPLTFVSGPSATSDIELKRVEGVHGPRSLHVILAE